MCLRGSPSPGPTVQDNVSSSAVDTDFMVRIGDVWNDEKGTVRLLRIMVFACDGERIRWSCVHGGRHGLQSADEPMEYSYVLAPGHSLR